MASVTNAGAENEVVDGEWVAFPGGELEGRSQRGCAALASCGAPPGLSRRAFCFTCHREEGLRRRALQAAAELDTASEARFQWGWPFEPVNRPRLARLKAETTCTRARCASKRPGSRIGAGTRRLLRGTHCSASAPASNRAACTPLSCSCRKPGCRS